MQLKFIKTTLYLCFLSGLGLQSCSSKQQSGGFLDEITSVFSASFDTLLVHKALDAQAAALRDSKSVDSNLFFKKIVSLYEANDYQLIWIENLKFTDKAEEFLGTLETLAADGLNPERYHSAELNTLVAQKLANDSAAASADVQLSYYFSKASYEMLMGAFLPRKVDKTWHIDNDSDISFVPFFLNDSIPVKELFRSLRPANPRYQKMLDAYSYWDGLQTDSGFLAAQASFKSGAESSELLRYFAQVKGQEVPEMDVASFQYYHQLSATNKLDSVTTAKLMMSPGQMKKLLAINMERLRWMPQSFTDQYIWVTIPQATVDYFNEGNNLFHANTIVGSKKTPTPSLAKNLQSIVLCPPWSIPHSIIKNEYKGRIPAKYHVLKNGKRVPNGEVNESNYRQYRVRQPAGPGAALGYVKFNLPNVWDIYLHDTPNRSLFGNKNRYLSHGCVRVKNPRDLAGIILADKGVSRDSIDRIIDKQKTVFVNTPKIPVYISYLTVGTDSNMSRLVFLNDVYGRDSFLFSKTDNNGLFLN